MIGRAAITALGTLTIAAGAFAAPAPIGLIDLAGQAVNPFAGHDARLLVFVFVRTDCPISNAYAPEVRRLCARYAPQRATFRLVYCDPDETPVMIRQHVADYAYPCPALRDPRGKFAARSRVKMTPEAAIYSPGGALLYHGRIDDRFVDFGKARPAPTERDLAQAIEAARAGRTVAAPAGPAVGCSIEMAK